MARIRSSLKRARQAQARTIRNLHVRSTTRGAVRRVRVACATGNLAQARELLLEASRQLDKAAGKGVLHRNAAARRKSRLARLVNSLAKKQDEEKPA